MGVVVLEEGGGGVPPLGSVLASDTRAQAVLHPSQGDVDDGNQALAGAQRAQQPVGISPLHNLHDVALVEAQLARFSGYVVAQGAHLTEGESEKSTVRLKV